MKTIFYFSLLIILMFVPTVHSQVPIADYDQLDSILLMGNPEAAIVYWSTVCSPATDDTVVQECGITTEQLQNLLDYVVQLKTQSPAYIGEIIADGKSKSIKYKESYAGPSAAHAFQSFLVAADSDDWLKAIIYLRTARFFKIPFLKMTLIRAHRAYVQADEYFDEGQFDSADSTLKTIRYDAGNHPALLAFADTISYLQQRVDGKLLKIEKYQYNWESTASVDSRLSFSITSKIISQRGINDFPLVMSNANSTIQVEVDRVISTYRFGLGLQAWYRLNERTSIGVGMNAAKFSYSSIHTQQLIFFDFDVAYTRAFVGGQYLLRSAVGLRPYLNLGLGIIRYKYDQFKTVIYRESSGYETYQVAAEDFTAGEATVTLGIQFVPKSNSFWALSSEISWYLPFKEHTFLPLPRIAVGFRIDLLL